MIRKIGVKIDNEIFEVILRDRAANRFVFEINGKTVLAELLSPVETLKVSKEQEALDQVERAPFVGVVGKIFVKPGDLVQKGQILLTLEAMKMENIIRARANGVVKEIKVNQGVKVEKGAELVEIEYK